MPEPATPRPLAGPPKNGADSNDPELDELRRLIVGPEQARLAKLQQRLDDPEIRAHEIGRVLPNPAIRKSLERLLRAILKRDPDVVVEAVRPIIFQAVRKAVADAFREFTENLSQIAEKSISPRALQWRFEAFRTGKKFSEVVLSRSLRYSVREVFLIHRKTGLLLQQAARKAVTKDADMVSSMFTAIQEFVRDSFIGTEGKELETIDLGSFKLWIQHGKHTMVAGAVTGTPPVELKRVFRDALQEIERNYDGPLQAFEGDVVPFEATRPILERCLLGQSGPKLRRSWIPWIIAAAVLIALGFWGFLVVRDQLRWSRYVQALRAQPGIVLTRAEKVGRSYYVAGLRDSMAADPAGLLSGTGIQPGSVHFQFEPYTSLTPGFSNQRNFDSGKAAVERYIVRFAPGKSDLSPEELDHIDAIAADIRTLLRGAGALQRKISIELIGHTDELGTEETNARLSQDRTEQVADALASAGIDRALLAPHGVGTTQPLRNGSSDRDRSFNRSVSLRVIENR